MFLSFLEIIDPCSTISVSVSFVSESDSNKKREFNIPLFPCSNVIYFHSALYMDVGDIFQCF